MPPSERNSDEQVNAHCGAKSRIDEILDALEEEGSDSTSQSDRKGVRRRFRTKLSIDVFQPGGNKSSHQVITRDLSATGLSFIHGGFLHLGTKCSLQLTTLDGAWQNITGEVLRCRLIKGRIHEIGVQFQESINLEDFLRQQLQGRMLLVDDDPGYSRLLAHHLQKSGIQVVIADRGFKALKLVKEQRFDIILTDHEMPGLDGVTLVKQLRESGETTPIIMLSANTTKELRDQSIEAGCHKFLTKPIGKDELLAVIEPFLSDKESLESSLAGNPDMAEFIDQFASDLPKRTSEIQEHLAEKKADELRSALGQLGAMASGCGFGPITESVQGLQTFLTDSPNWESVQTGVNELLQFCARVPVPNLDA